GRGCRRGPAPPRGSESPRSASSWASRSSLVGTANLRVFAQGQRRGEARDHDSRGDVAVIKAAKPVSLDRRHIHSSVHNSGILWISRGLGESPAALASRNASGPAPRPYGFVAGTPPRPILYHRLRERTR